MKPQSSQEILEDGSYVLVRNRCLERKTIQDKWFSNPFIAVTCLDTAKDISLIQPLDKSRSRRVDNRIDS